MRNNDNSITGKSIVPGTVLCSFYVGWPCNYNPNWNTLKSGRAYICNYSRTVRCKVDYMIAYLRALLNRALTQFWFWNSAPSFLQMLPDLHMVPQGQWCHQAHMSDPMLTACDSGTLLSLSTKVCRRRSSWVFTIFVYLTDPVTSTDTLFLYLFSRLNEQSRKAHSSYASPPPLYFLKHLGLQH